MDGSGSAFLLDEQFVSARMPQPRGGILYVEDFDADPSAQDHAAQDALPPPEPTFSAAELEAARQAGRQDGMQQATEDARLIQMQMHAASLQSLTDGLVAARASLQSVAQAHAAQTARAVFGILQAALPAAMRTHAAVEAQAMLAALAPGLTCEPELRVRAHPDMADTVRESLIALLPDQTCVLSVCADPALAPGDVIVAWQDGRARRDTGAIWSQIRAALAPLALPTIEELCRGC
jgi:flagellar assembly protein FliH